MEFEERHSTPTVAAQAPAHEEGVKPGLHTTTTTMKDRIEIQQDAVIEVVPKPVPRPFRE